MHPIRVVAPWYSVCTNGFGIIKLMTDRFALLWPGVPLALASAVLFGASTPLRQAAARRRRRSLAAGRPALSRRRHRPRRRCIWRAARCGCRPTRRRCAAPTCRWLALRRPGRRRRRPAAADARPRAHRRRLGASLLLNLEGLATMAHRLAGVPRERRPPPAARRLRHPGRRRRCCPGRAARSRSASGALLIAGACLAWGIDNNLTRKVCPPPIRCRSRMIKGLVAGSVNLALALVLGAHAAAARRRRWPPASSASSATASASCCSCWRCAISAPRAPAPISRWRPFVGAVLAVAPARRAARPCACSSPAA